MAAARFYFRPAAAAVPVRETTALPITLLRRHDKP